MRGLLSSFFGSPDQTQALGLLGLGMMNGGFGQGAELAMKHLAGADERKLKRSLLDAQLEETRAQADERRTKAQREQAAMELERRKREALPRLYASGGLTGGAPVPQTEGGIPMFSRPMGVSPMQGQGQAFDWMTALREGFTVDEIQKLAGLSDIGRPKATRQMEVDDGRGGKRIALVDDFGREVAGFAGYTPPVQVNRGNQIDFVKPAPGLSLPVGMSPSERDAAARGWAGVGLQRDRLNLDRNQAEQGKWQYDATRGGLVNLQTGEFKPATKDGKPVETKASQEAAKEDQRRLGAISQADSVLQEVRDAKGLVGWNTAGLGGALSAIPATDARNLSAKLQTVKANLGFDRLQQMREQSPTGGALGSVAQQELAALQATVASLDQLQSPSQLGMALDKIEQHYTNWRNVMRQAQDGSQGGASGGWGKPKTKGGASVSNW